MVKTERFRRLQADLILLLVAAIWGSAFVAQRVAAAQTGIFLFNGSRFLIGGLVLLPLVGRGEQRSLTNEETRGMPTWVLVALAGALLFAAGNLQHYGLRFTTAANAGFITGLYVVFVPLLLVFIWRRRLVWQVWLAVMLAGIGIYLLSAPTRLHFNPGDLLELAGALFWALHVLLIDHLVRRIRLVRLAVGQYLVCAVLNLLLAFGLEWNTLPGLLQVWWAVVYTGVLSVAVGYTLQAFGQRYAPPTDAVLLLSAEAVFAAVFGYLLLGELLEMSQIIGCVVIMGAILLAQLRPASGGRQIEERVDV